MRRSTARRSTVTALDLIYLEDDLITLNEHVETGFSAPELENFTKQSEGSVCQNELPESGLGKTPTLQSVSAPAGKMVATTENCVGIQLQDLPTEDVGRSLVTLTPRISLGDDPQSLFDERFDCEIRTPEAIGSDTEGTPLKTLLDSPMSFKEKVLAARERLRDFVERSASKDLDHLFALLTPSSGAPSVNSSVSIPDSQGLLDLETSATKRAGTFHRSNSLLRRRPESFGSTEGQLAELAQKAQEQEKLLYEAGLETARKLREKRNSPVSEVPPQTPVISTAAASTSPLIVPHRLSFDGSPQATPPQPLHQPVIIPQPNLGLTPLPSRIPSPPKSALKSGSKGLAHVNFAPLPVLQTVPVLPPSPRIVELVNVLPKMGTVQPLLAKGVPPINLPKLPRLPQNLPPRPFSSRLSSSFRVSKSGGSGSARPSADGRTNPNPLRAVHAAVRPLPLKPAEARFSLHPAIAESVARLSTPKKNNSPSPKGSPENPQNGCNSHAVAARAKTPSPPKAVGSAKRRLSFVPSPMQLSLPKQNPVPNGFGGKFQIPMKGPAGGTLRRQTMTQKALTENLPYRFGSIVGTKPGDFRGPVPAATVHNRKSSTGNSSGGSSVASNNENLLIDL